MASKTQRRIKKSHYHSSNGYSVIKYQFFCCIPKLYTKFLKRTNINQGNPLIMLYLLLHTIRFKMSKYKYSSKCILSTAFWAEVGLLMVFAPSSPQYATLFGANKIVCLIMHSNIGTDTNHFDSNYKCKTYIQFFQIHFVIFCTALVTIGPYGIFRDY